MITGVSVSNDQWNALGKMVYLATDKVWILGNIDEVTTLRQVYHLEIATAAPLSVYASNVAATASDDVDLPHTLEEWHQAQQGVDFTNEYSPDQLSNIVAHAGANS